MDPDVLLQKIQGFLAEKAGLSDKYTRALSTGGNINTWLMSLGISPSDVHVDRALTNLAVSFRNNEFIADLVCPVVEVPKRSDKYFKMDADTYFNEAKVDIASLRGRPGEINLGLTTDDFKVKDYGLMSFLPFDVEANQDAPLNMAMEEVEALMNFLALARERRVSSLYFTAANYGSNTEALTSTARWDDSGSDPANKVEQILDTCLARPNVAILGVKVWYALRSHPKFRAYIEARATASGKPTPLRPTLAMVAEAFELDAIYVPRARYNTAGDGATASVSRIWTQESAAFVRVDKTPSVRRTESFAHTFRFAPPGGSSMAVQTWFDKVPGTRGGTWYKLTHSDVEKLVGGSNSGYLLTTVVA